MLYERLVTIGNEFSTRTWRERFSDTLTWLAFICFLVTLPLSFPGLVIYKKWRREKWGGKGMALLVPLWAAMTGVFALLVAAYAKKGFAGLRTLFWIVLVWAIWVIIVFVAMRLILEVIVLIGRVLRLIDKRSKR